MKRYLFFLRHYNDIDNIAPAIYFLLKSDSDYLVDIIVYSFDYDYRNDNNLKFLIEEFEKRIKVIPVEEILKVNRAFFRKDYIGFGYRKFILRTLQPQKYINGIITNNSKHSNACDNLVKKIIKLGPNPYAAVFDQNREFAIGGIVKSLRKFNIPVVALPVSPLVTLNTMRVDLYKERGLSLVDYHHSYNFLDKIAFTDNLYLQELQKHYSLAGQEIPFKEKIEILGSIRYCREWMKIREQYIERYNFLSKKTKIAFFLTNPKNNVFWEEILRVIELLSHYPEYTIVIKPHTRPITRLHRFFKKEIKFNPATEKYTISQHKNISLDSEVNSSSLINWADIVMFWGTSIAIEGYIKGKIMLYLDFVHSNKIVYESFNAGLILKTRDDLVFALEELIKNPRANLYDKNNINGLIDKIVYDNKKNPSVPERYVNFLKSV